MDGRSIFAKILIIEFLYSLATYLVDNSFKNWLTFQAIPVIFILLYIAVFSNLDKN